MFESIWGLLTLAVTFVAGIGSFMLTREFVRQRLRFVDAARHPIVPWMAGGIVLLLAQPIALLLPLVTGFTGLIAGVAAGLGTASGVKALKRGE